MAVTRCAGPNPFGGLRGGSSETMLIYAMAVILLIVWFLGVVGDHTLGGLIHLLLLLAIVAVIFRLVQGREAI